MDQRRILLSCIPPGVMPRNSPTWSPSGSLAAGVQPVALAADVHGTPMGTVMPT